MRPGMIPILHSPGVMTPGQFGPIRRTMSPVALISARKALTRIMSLVGTPSVMQAMIDTRASAASTIASAAKGGGTKIIEALAPVEETASATVLKTGIPSWVVPPLPGVTPATTRVPYSRLASAWNVPSRPVRPWTRRRVSLPTQMLMGRSSHGLDGLPRGVGEAVGRSDLQFRIPQDSLAFVHVGSFETDDDGRRKAHLFDGRDDALGDDVAAHDAAENVDQDRLYVLIREDDPEGVLDLLLGGAPAHVQEVGRLAPGELD